MLKSHMWHLYQTAQMHDTSITLETPGRRCFRCTKPGACSPPGLCTCWSLCLESSPTLFFTYWTPTHLLRPRVNITSTEKHLKLSTLSQTLLHWRHGGTRDIYITKLPVHLPHETVGSGGQGLHLIDFHSQYLGQGQAQSDFSMNLSREEAAQI